MTVSIPSMPSSSIFWPSDASILRRRYTKPESRSLSFFSSSSSVRPTSGASRAATAAGSSIRNGWAKTVTASSDTARSTPWRSMIVPRGAGTTSSSICCWTARSPSESDLTVPSHAARAVAAPSSNRKRAKRSPIRRSTSFIPGVRARGARERMVSFRWEGRVGRRGRDRGGGVGRGDRLGRGRLGRRDDALGRVVGVELRLRLEVADLSGRRVDEPERGGCLLDALAAREARVVVAEAIVLALELRRLLRHLGDVAVHLEQVDVEEDDPREQHADQPDPDPAGEEGVEDAGAAGKGGGSGASVAGYTARRGGGGARGRPPPPRPCPGRRRAAHQAASPASLRAARRRPDFARGLLATSPGVGATARPVN